MVKNRKVNDYLLLLLLLLFYFLCFFLIFFLPAPYPHSHPRPTPATHTRDPRLLVATRDPPHLATLVKVHSGKGERCRA